MLWPQIYGDGKALVIMTQWHNPRLINIFACPQVEENTPVAIYGEDKELAMAIGFTAMSTEQVRWVLGCHLETTKAQIPYTHNSELEFRNAKPR